MDVDGKQLRQMTSEVCYPGQIRFRLLRAPTRAPGTSNLPCQACPAQPSQDKTSTFPLPALFTDNHTLPKTHRKKKVDPSTRSWR